MTKDKTVTMSRELAESLLTEATNQNWSDLNILLNAPSDSSECRCRRFGKNNPHWPCPVHPIAAPVVERQPRAWEIRYKDGDDHQGFVETEERAAYYRSMAYHVIPLYTSPPAPVAVVQHPFADKVISKLQRFVECADDGQGADIGRHWIDILTQLCLLNRVQHSPGLWEMTQQGEDCLDKVKEMNR